MLDLESEAMRGRGSIPTKGNILSLDLFHLVKPLMPILALLPICLFVKNPIVVIKTVGSSTQCTRHSYFVVE